MSRNVWSRPYHQIRSCQVNKCKDEKGQWKASVLGTVFRCSVLGYIQVSYDIFAGVYVQAMCRISVLLLNAWGWQTSISSIFSRLPCSELGSPARKQVWKGTEIGWKHLAPTPHLLSPSMHQSIIHTWKYVSMCTQIAFSRNPLVVFGVYTLYIPYRHNHMLSNYSGNPNRIDEPKVARSEA